MFPAAVLSGSLKKKNQLFISSGIIIWIKRLDQHVTRLTVNSYRENQHEWKIRVECWQNSWLNVLHSDSLIDANLKVLLSLHLFNLPNLWDQTWSGQQSPLHHRQSFPCWCSKVLLTTFFKILAKVVSKIKLICYNAESLKLVYLLMLAIFPHKHG